MAGAISTTTLPKLPEPIACCITGVVRSRIRVQLSPPSFDRKMPLAEMPT